LVEVHWHSFSRAARPQIDRLRRRTSQFGEANAAALSGELAGPGRFSADLASNWLGGYERGRNFGVRR
jgi:hypothetical protein